MWSLANYERKYGAEQGMYAPIVSRDKWEVAHVAFKVFTKVLL